MIYLSIQTRSATPVYVQIMDQIRGHVRSGTLAPGAPLPSVRQLARDLSVNPNTVAKAYLLLEREGLIQTARRKGTFVSETGPSRAQEAGRRRLDQALDRLLSDADEMGLDRNDLLTAIRRKLSGIQPRKGEPR